MPSREFYCETTGSWGVSEGAGPKQVAACSEGELVILKAEEIEVVKK